MNNISDGLLAYIDSLELNVLELNDQEINRIHQKAINKVQHKKITKRYPRWKLASGLVAACLILLISINSLIDRPCPVPNTNISNPQVEYSSVENAEQTLGYDALIPNEIPQGYTLAKIYVIDNNLLSIDYMKDSDVVNFRTAPGSEDVSGDFNHYELEKTVTIDQISILLKGNANSFNLAIWQTERYSFSILSSAGILENEMIKMIKSINFE